MTQDSKTHNDSGSLQSFEGISCDNKNTKRNYTLTSRNLEKQDLLKENSSMVKETTTNHGNQNNLMNSSSFTHSVPALVYSIPTTIGGLQIKKPRTIKEGY